MADEPSFHSPSDSGGHSYFQNFQHTPVGARVPEKVGRGVFATTLMVLQTNDLFVLDLLLMTSQPQQVVARIIMTTAGFSSFLDALRMNVSRYESDIGPLNPRGAPHGPGFPPLPGSPDNAPASGEEGKIRADAPGLGSIFVDSIGGEASPPGGLPPQTGGGMAPETPHVHSLPPNSRPITELYEQVRFPEELLGGSFANAVVIRHTPEEFCFDFISSLYPRPIVVSRVFTPAGRVRSFIDAMTGSLERYKSGGGPGRAEQ